MAKLYPTVQAGTANDYLEPIWKRIPRNTSKKIFGASSAVVSQASTPSLNKRYKVRVTDNDSLINFTSTNNEELVFFKQSSTGTDFYDTNHISSNQSTRDMFESTQPLLQLLGMCNVHRDVQNNIDYFTLMIHDEPLTSYNFDYTIKTPLKLWYRPETQPDDNNETQPFGYIISPAIPINIPTWYVDIATIHYTIPINIEEYPDADKTTGFYSLLEPHNQLHLYKEPWM